MNASPKAMVFINVLKKLLLRVKIYSFKKHLFTRVISFDENIQISVHEETFVVTVR